jgi:SAM-dependent methyltransferase
VVGVNEDPLGFVETPPALADELAGQVMPTTPKPGDRILYPGAGRGKIAAAVHRRCSVRDIDCPDAVFVERDAQHLETLRDRFVGEEASHNHGVPPLSDESTRCHRPMYGSISKARVDADVEIRHTDILLDPPPGTFEYIVANPPYTAYSEIERERREAYADRFETATGQFHLYTPFVEQMLDLLAQNGVLVVLLPDRWLTLEAARPLRDRLRQENPCTPILVPEPAFPDHKVQTTIAVVGRSDAPWTGQVRPPSRTSLYLTHMHGQSIRPFLKRVGVDAEDLEAVRSKGFSDAAAGKQQTGAGRNTDDVEQLAAEAKDVLGGYFREFTMTASEVGGWEQDCDCETDETKAGLVLDPFAGAGTTCLVAKRLGRRFIGIDLNPEYVAMAQKRVGVTVDAPELLLDEDETHLAAFADGGGSGD